MKAKVKKPRRIPRKILEAIDEALKEIEVHFTFDAFGSESEETVEGVEPEEAELEGVEPERVEAERVEPEHQSEEDEVDDYDDYDEDPYPSSISAEEVEVSIDLFISELVQKGVITREIATSFSEVFEHFFGWDHQITKNAQAFEEEIEGYFGSINYEEMRSAHSSITQIRTILDQEMGRSATK